jgi:hypothetical protein
MKRLAIIALVLALASCGKKKDEPAAMPPAGSAAPAPAGSGSAAPAGSAAPTPAPAPAAQVDVPTEQDFEAGAKTAVDDKNVEAKVKAIETELGQQ